LFFWISFAYGFPFGVIINNKVQSAKYKIPFAWRRGGANAPG
jgi:hypothetical protein